jgi:mannose-6-phosphate isomerase-like protein (cupin superfamily)
VLRGDEDGGGQSVIVHLTVRPHGAVVGEHVHPALTERFVVISGTLATRIGGVEGALSAGEEATATPGTPHDWWNAGDMDAGVLVEISPPNPRFEMAIATTFGLANAGKTNAKGMPNPLQMALVGQEFSDVIRFTKPPRGGAEGGIHCAGGGRASARLPRALPGVPQTARPRDARSRGDGAGGAEWSDRRFGGSVATNARARSTQPVSASSVVNPGGSTITMLFIGRPVNVIGRVWGSSSAASASSGPRRSISVSPMTPQTMFPCWSSARPPNIFCSEMPSTSASTSPIRAASCSS